MVAMNAIIAVEFEDVEEAMAAFVRPLELLKSQSYEEAENRIAAEDIRVKAQNYVLLHMEMCDSSDIQASDVFALCNGKMDHGESRISLETLFTCLTPFFSSDDGSVRKHAMILLGVVLTRCRSIPVSQKVAERIIRFCSTRLFDWYFIEGVALTFLGLLENHRDVVASGVLLVHELYQDRRNNRADPHSTPGDTCEQRSGEVSCVRVILDSILRDVHAPSFAQPIRHTILQTLSMILREFPEHVYAIGRKVATRIFCQLENEKDPRNLIINFPLIEYLLKHYGDLVSDQNIERDHGGGSNRLEEGQDEVSQRLDMIADVLLSYFPIRFKPVHSDIYNVTEDDLQRHLSRCFLANPVLASRLLDGCLDMLNDSLASQKSDDVQDAINMFCECLEHFNKNHFALQYAKPFFDVIKLAAWHTFCRDLPVLTAALARVIRLAVESGSADDVLNYTLKPCVQLLLSSHSENSGPYELTASRRIVLDSAREDPRLLRHVVTMILGEPDPSVAASYIQLTFKLMQKVSSIERKPSSMISPQPPHLVSQQLYNQWIADFEFYTDFTLILFQGITDAQGHLDAVRPLVFEFYQQILSVAEQDSGPILDSLTPSLEEAAVHFLDILANLTACIAVPVPQCKEIRNEESLSTEAAPTIVHNTTDVYRCLTKAFKNMSYIVGLREENGVDTWALRWYDFVQSGPMDDNRLRLVKLFNRCLIRCTRSAPTFSYICLQQHVMHILRANYECGIISALRLMTSMQVATVWCGADDPSLFTLLFSVVFKTLRHVFRGEVEEGSSQRESPLTVDMQAVDVLCLGIKELAVFIKTGSIDSHSEYLIVAMDRLLTDTSSEVEALHLFFSQLQRFSESTNLEMDTCSKLEGIISLFKTFLSLIFFHCEDPLMLGRCVVTLEQHPSTSDAPLNSLVVLLPSVLPPLLQYLEHKQEGWGELSLALSSVVRRACTIACGVTSPRQRHMSPLAQQIVIASYRSTLVALATQGPPLYCEQISDTIERTAAEPPHLFSILHTSTTRGYLIYALVWRAWKKNPQAAYNVFRDLLVNLLQDTTTRHTDISQYFTCALTLRASLALDPRCLSALEKSPLVHETTGAEELTLSLSGVLCPNAETFPFLHIVQQCSITPPYLTSCEDQQSSTACMGQILERWYNSTCPNERISLCTTLFLLLTTIPLKASLEYMIGSNHSVSIVSILVWTFKSFPWCSPHDLLLSPCSSSERLQFQAEIDRMYGYTVLFTLLVLQRKVSPTLSHERRTGSEEIHADVELELRTWFTELLASVNEVIRAALYQATTNSIPGIRITALHCIYLIGTVKSQYPDIALYTTMVRRGLEVPRNDSRYLVRRAAAVCANYWSSI